MSKLGGNIYISPAIRISHRMRGLFTGSLRSALPFPCMVLLWIHIVVPFGRWILW